MFQFYTFLFSAAYFGASVMDSKAMPLPDEVSKRETVCPRRHYRQTFPNGTAQCVPCTDCPPGMGVRRYCREESNTWCEPCLRGISYSSRREFSSCHGCVFCRRNERTIKRCTPTSQTLCGSCFAGFYRSQLTLECNRCSYCYPEIQNYGQQAPDCNISDVPIDYQCYYVTPPPSPETTKQTIPTEITLEQTTLNITTTMLTETHLFANVTMKNKNLTPEVFQMHSLSESFCEASCYFAIAVVSVVFLAVIILVLILYLFKKMKYPERSTSSEFICHYRNYDMDNFDKMENNLRLTDGVSVEEPDTLTLRGSEADNQGSQNGASSIATCDTTETTITESSPCLGQKNIGCHNSNDFVRESTNAKRAPLKSTAQDNATTTGTNSVSASEKTLSVVDSNNNKNEDLDRKRESDMSEALLDSFDAKDMSTLNYSNLVCVSSIKGKMTEEGNHDTKKGIFQGLHVFQETKGVERNGKRDRKDKDASTLFLVNTIRVASQVLTSKSKQSWLSFVDLLKKGFKFRSTKRPKNKYARPPARLRMSPRSEDSLLPVVCRV